MHARMSSFRVHPLFAALIACWFISGLAASCGDDDAPAPILPIIADIQYVSPVIEGSILAVSVGNPEQAGDRPTLDVRIGDESLIELSPLEDRVQGLVRYEVNGGVISALGAGVSSVDFVLISQDGARESAEYPEALNVATRLNLEANTSPSGDVHRGESFVLTGDGFIAPSEGTFTAFFEGTFTPDGGGSVEVNAEIPVELSGRSRDEAVVELNTAIGGSRPGVFEGNFFVETSLDATGDRQSTTPTSISLTFLLPEIFEVRPEDISLEQIIQVVGAGFLGGSEGSTVLRLEGTLTPEGSTPRDVPPSEFILEYVDHENLAGPLSAVEQGNRLVSEILGISRGSVEGTVTPVTLFEGEEVVGLSAPFRFELGPLRQIIWLRFLPDFYGSLARFGLAGSAGRIEELVKERIEGIYDRWNIEVRLEEPTDFSPVGYSTVEIGGPDPNGRGLFGYDNTPGKDIGNVRLFDAIGGANAETQEGGAPGYGGVFVESFFSFSQNPPADLPSGGPEPDPLFDEIFDPVRQQAATLDEIQGRSGRVGEVERALRALASIVGETTAHEIGHSLGLASPYGSASVFHNRGNEPGCLMDSGSSRPFGERAQQAGFAETILCGDGPDYLDEILRD